ncbi:MAG: Heme A synthase [Gemmatimonadaceae bacterium]|nr:Heme A synthase [Gemmatimonadaceae bacterium]
MTGLRRLSWATLVFAVGHIVFGAIVRITGSGMGCGEHWPRCHGYWFPPFSRPDLIIEVSHRYFAATLTAAILVCVAWAWRRRREPGVGGSGGVLWPLLVAAGLVVAAALFGAVTVILALANKAVIVTHLAIAMSLLGAMVVAIVRAGPRPRIKEREYDARSSGASSLDRAANPHAASVPTSRRTARSAYGAAAIAFLTLVLGALTAHVPGANSSCTGFPLCAGGLLPTDPSQHLQFTHRVLAFLLTFHLAGLAVGTRRRGERIVAPMALLATTTTLAQVAVAAVMVELSLPAIWRSLHEAVGTLAWVAVCFMAYVAHISRVEPRAEAASDRSPSEPATSGVSA